MPHATAGLERVLCMQAVVQRTINRANDVAQRVWRTANVLDWMQMAMNRPAGDAHVNLFPSVLTANILMTMAYTLRCPMSTSFS
jgi:hypothetical protein